MSAGSSVPFRPWLVCALTMPVAVVATFLVSFILFYPRNPAGLDELGWFIFTAIAVIPVAIGAGALARWRALLAAQVPRAGQTALMFVPTALLLSAVTCGLGAFVAPFLASWLVRGLHRPATVAAGTRRGVLGVLHRLTATGVWQRVLISAVLAGIIGYIWLQEMEDRWGGELYGPQMIWASTLPVALGTPLLLVGRRSWTFTIALAVAGAALAVPISIDAPRYAYPSVQRLDHDISAVALPADTSVHQHVVTTVADSYLDYDPPVVSRGADAELTGNLHPFSRHTRATLPEATPRGREVAAQWAANFRAAGWRNHRHGPSPDVSEELQALLDREGVIRLTYQLRVDLYILPGGDGAVALAITH